MVDLEQATRQLSDLCKSVTIRKRLNMAASQQNNLRFIPAAFSHAGQTHAEFKALVREQIRHKLIDSKGKRKAQRLELV